MCVQILRYERNVCEFIIIMVMGLGLFSNSFFLHSLVRLLHLLHHSLSMYTHTLFIPYCIRNAWGFCVSLSFFLAASDWWYVKDISNNVLSIARTYHWCNGIPLLYFILIKMIKMFKSVKSLFCLNMFILFQFISATDSVISFACSA